MFKKQAKGLESLWDWKAWYQQKQSCNYIKLPSHHTLLIVTSHGTSARLATGESLSAYKKEDSGQYLRINVLATRKLLAKADMPSLFNRRLQDIAILMYKITHKLLPQRLWNLFQLDSGSYYLRKREFVQPRFSYIYMTATNSKAHWLLWSLYTTKYCFF